MRNEVRWGIVGCGNVTEVKSGPAFQLARGSRLVAVMRRQLGLAEDYARRHGVPHAYGSAEQLIHDPDVDAVYVATPVGSHQALALEVCAAGKPCYVEKPMARHAGECREMVQAFARRGLPLFVAYYRRALPRFLGVEAWLKEGIIGPVRQVEYRYSSLPDPLLRRESLPWRLKAECSGGGLFLDLASHTLDILDYLLGPIAFRGAEARRRCSAYDVEDFVTLEFTAQEGQVAGRAVWDFQARERVDQLTITGPHGRILLSTFGNEPIRLLRGEEPALERSLPNPPHIQLPLIQSIVDDLQGQGCCASTGMSAARTSVLMDQALSRFYRGREDDFWTRPETWDRSLCTTA